jgi:hypothetical protein
MVVAEHVQRDEAQAARAGDALQLRERRARHAAPARRFLDLDAVHVGAVLPARLDLGPPQVTDILRFARRVRHLQLHERVPRRGLALRQQQRVRLRRLLDRLGQRPLPVLDMAERVRRDRERQPGLVVGVGERDEPDRRQRHLTAARRSPRCRSTALR